ncbi:MAG: protein kinase [Gemmatimonadetes bacterium]|nr:protein kinase [Gemmatimonadota bacterium]
MTDTVDFSAQYKVEREIGQGGMAYVYLAHDIKHDRQVAIKVLRPDVGEGIGKDRFLREIKLAAGLTHPHILPVHDSGEADGRLYFVMPFVEGASLGTRLMREQRVPLDEALEITRAVASALDYAHRAGVIHRDIKPDNILVHEGTAVVADFGIGKALNTPGDDAITQTGALLGTPSYMSPEQILGSTDIDGRSDLFSLGCVLYEMLAGERLFVGPNLQALIALRLSQRDQETSLPPNDFPPEVQLALEKVLATKPGDRYGTGAAFVEALTKPSAVSVPQAFTPSEPIAPPAAKSIAVLPFANMSPDPENEYFSDGITEEIINALAQMPDLHVASRTSSFAFKNKMQDMAEIGARLRVANVLEGSVRKAGSKLRITAQLINAADGYHLWSERYDREMDDVFAIQEEIAAKIASELKVKFAASKSDRPVQPPTDNLEAYQLYLKGRYLWNQRDKAGLRQATEYYLRAIERDPNYAPAYAGLADTYLLMAAYHFMDGSEAHEKAKEAVERALALDEGMAEAHASRAQLLRDEMRWEEEEREYQRAIELNPNYPTAHQWYGTMLVAQGRFEEAIREIRKAEKLDPLSHAISVTVAVVLFMARKYNRALRQLHTALELEPDFASTHAWFGIVYAQLGRHDEAVRSSQRAAELNPDNPNVLAGLAQSYAVTGQRDKALELIGDVKQRGGAAWIASSYTALGETDLAFEWLDKMVDQPDAWQLMYYLNVYPFFDPLRSDPRYPELAKRLGFPT